MQKIKKTIAMLATFALACSLMATSAFAAAIGTGVATTGENQITIPKGVTFINADAVTSYGPGITFTYTIAPASLTDGAMTVKDAEGHTTTVHAGPADGLTLAENSITFGSNETFTTSSEGVEATKNIVLNFDASKFTKPGVYRYVLTDTTATSALYIAGITRDGDYDTTRFIDVFVKRGTSGMEVYGYALKLDNSNTDGTATPATAKDPGFIASSPAEGANTDKYETYNVTLTKRVEGALGDYNHEFPFAVTISNDGKNYYAAKGDINAAKAATADAQTAKSTTLKHEEVFTIAGLSPHATVAYQETNDTTDLYDVTVAGSSSDISVTANDTTKTYAIEAGAVSSYDTDNSNSSVATVGTTTNYSAVTYTNTLSEVSPTGFIQHYGMLFALIGVGVIMLIMSRHTEDEEL